MEIRPPLARHIVTFAPRGGGNIAKRSFLDQY